MTDENPNLALEFLENVNSLYLQCDESQRESFWRMLKKPLEAKEGLVLQDDKIDGIVMQQLINTQKFKPNFELGARLLKTYISQVKKGNEHVTPFLQYWILTGLEALSNGQKSDDVFGLGREKGRPKGSPVYSDLQISCAYHYFLSTGHKKMQAEDRVEKQFCIEKRTIARIKKRFPIPDDIDTDVLKAMMDKDYRALYGEL